MAIKNIMKLGDVTMMERYELTAIWKKTLAEQGEIDTYKKERTLLRKEFESMRDKAKILAGEISKDLPNFTVHDINHIDALWETTDLVIGDNFDINPAEAFVLGSTFLIHDLGMGLASYPDGIKKIKKELVWRDTVAALIKEKKPNHILSDKDYLKPDRDIEKQATENVLRLLHAKNAEKLAYISWKGSASEEIHLIADIDLRATYGSIIGAIAYSHWWSVEELEDKLPNQILGAPSIFPSCWSIDPIKLACILRIADAIQIDDRRAPIFLRILRKLSPEAEKHWKFQQKLFQPVVINDRLCISSKSPFSITEFDSWWTCFDTLSMIDKELRDVDSLLIGTNRQRLKVIGVTAIEDAARLSKLITVNGWKPVDAKIKVENVARLVSNLGGQQLYGNNSIVPLRELIQNASDAVRARRILEAESESFGKITVKFGKDVDGKYVEVEDNGIGMSLKVLTGPFLDFGQSFWGTSLMHEELPGLESKGFSSTGKYGIGFFSVFMWGKKVTVTTKRYESGRDSTLVLEFNEGVTARPILRQARTEEFIKDGGTRIRVWLSKSDIIENLLKDRRSLKRKITYEELITSLCPSIDCNVVLNNNTEKIIIKANDWITIEPIDLINGLATLS